jgi:hypothetical protein
VLLDVPSLCLGVFVGKDTRNLSIDVLMLCFFSSLCSVLIKPHAAPEGELLAALLEFDIMRGASIQHIRDERYAQIREVSVCLMGKRPNTWLTAIVEDNTVLKEGPRVYKHEPFHILSQQSAKDKARIWDERTCSETRVLLPQHHWCVSAMDPQILTSMKRKFDGDLDPKNAAGEPVKRRAYEQSPCVSVTRSSATPNMDPHVVGEHNSTNHNHVSDSSAIGIDNSALPRELNETVDVVHGSDGMHIHNTLHPKFNTALVQDTFANVSQGMECVDTMIAPSSGNANQDAVHVIDIMHAPTDAQSIIHQHVEIHDDHRLSDFQTTARQSLSTLESLFAKASMQSPQMQELLRGTIPAMQDLFGALGPLVDQSKVWKKSHDDRQQEFAIEKAKDMQATSDFLLNLVDTLVDMSNDNTNGEHEMSHYDFTPADLGVVSVNAGMAIPNRVQVDDSANKNADGHSVRVAAGQELKRFLLTQHGAQTTIAKCDVQVLQQMLLTMKSSVHTLRKKLVVASSIRTPIQPSESISEHQSVSHLANVTDDDLQRRFLPPPLHGNDDLTPPPILPEDLSDAWRTFHGVLSDSHVLNSTLLKSTASSTNEHQLAALDVTNRKGQNGTLQKETISSMHVRQDPPPVHVSQTCYKASVLPVSTHTDPQAVMRHKIGCPTNANDGHAELQAKFSSLGAIGATMLAEFGGSWDNLPSVPVSRVNGHMVPTKQLQSKKHIPNRSNLLTSCASDSRQRGTPLATTSEGNWLPVHSTPSSYGQIKTMSTLPLQQKTSADGFEAVQWNQNKDKLATEYKRMFA